MWVWNLTVSAPQAAAASMSLTALPKEPSCTEPISAMMRMSVSADRSRRRALRAQALETGDEVARHVDAHLLGRDAGESRHLLGRGRLEIAFDRDRFESLEEDAQGVM